MEYEYLGTDGSGNRFVARCPKCRMLLREGEECASCNWIHVSSISDHHPKCETCAHGKVTTSEYARRAQRPDHLAGEWVRCYFGGADRDLNEYCSRHTALRGEEE